MRRASFFSLLVFCLALAATSFTSPTAGHGAGIAQGSSTWGQQTSGTTNELRSVHFTSEMEGWAAGANATLLRTTNGGANWATVSISGFDPANGFNTVRLFNQNTVWVGGRAALARSLNGGADWAVATLPTSVLSASNLSYNSFFPVSATEVWTGGGGQSGSAAAGFFALFILNSGGALTRDISGTFGGGSGPQVLDLHFLAVNNGWFIQGGGSVVRFSPSGSSGINPSFHFGASGQNAIFMINSTTGWIVGNNGAILKTVNGTSWNDQTSGTAANLRDVHFVDANRGWAVGDGGVILTTSDGGAMWSPEQSGVTANLRSVFFVNANTGFAVGDGGVILKRGAPSGPAAVATVSAASFSGAELAAESIAAAFGQGFATTTEVATSVPLPTVLAGASVQVRDSAGMERAAPLFFAAPGQINYQIPPGTANGTANISVVRNGTIIAAGAIPIGAVAPGLFAANANGQGVAAAVVFRRKAGGAESFEPVAQFDQAQNRFVVAPIDLGPATDQVSLILFGTGIRFRSALSAVMCNIGGASAPVSFAEAQGGFVGLDQVNVSLPRSLAGRGEVDVVLMVDGKTANTVRIAVK